MIVDFDRAVDHPDIAQHAEIGNREHRDFRIDHGVCRDLAGARQQSGDFGLRRAFGRGAWSPFRPRIGALQELQFGKDEAEMLGMPAVAAAALHEASVGTLQRRFVEHVIDAFVDRPRAKRAESTATPASIKARSTASISNNSPV